MQECNFFFMLFAVTMYFSPKKCNIKKHRQKAGKIGQIHVKEWTLPNTMHKNKLKMG